MSYARKTFSDSNAVKRFFQRRRLKDALRLVEPGRAPNTIVDFGAGNGELCKSLAKTFPGSRLVCYEPHPELLDQARQNLAGLPGVRFTADLPRQPADLLFCLEVFEHLPQRESSLVLGQIRGLLRDDGIAILGVPIETGIPALYKGLFRMARRHGDHDARLGNILRAFAGRPPGGRPVVELLPGSYYHLHHLGFDHRSFGKRLGRDFEILKTATSPLPGFGPAVNSELHFVVRAKNGRA